MRQASAYLQVADGQLADGMAAVVGVQPGGGVDAVGHQPVVAPGWEQLLLVTQVADATHDQPVAPIGSLGDLRDPPGGKAMSTQWCSGMAAIAARTVLVWRTVIE